MKNYRRRTNGELNPLPVAEGRWLDVSLDFITGLPITSQGHDMIMVVTDRFSKRAHFIAANKTFTPFGVIRLWYRFIFRYHGFPRIIMSDRVIKFTFNWYDELTKRLGIKLLMSSTNHPQTDGQTANVNKTLGQLLKPYFSMDHNSWDIYLPHIEFTGRLWPYDLNILGFLVICDLFFYLISERKGIDFPYF